MKITDILAREILDSRGNPTLEVEVFLEDGSYGRAAVPSGSSIGSKEALELRDGDQKRFNGKGLLKNIQIINEIIAPTLIGLDAGNQLNIDGILINLDATENKSFLGANTLLGVSLANAKAAAKSLKVPLFRYISPLEKYTLPIPLINIINGGVHADNQLDLQEFMISPVKAESFPDSMRIASEIFHSLKSLLVESGYNTNYGDEGGFAPALFTSIQALNYIEQACIRAGYILGEDIVLAIDAAASEFYLEGKYRLKGENKEYSSFEMIEYYENLVSQFPIYSIEDPMSEHDIEGWRHITIRLGKKIQLVGDDLFVSNPKIFQEGIKQNLGNAILIKPNQIGTLSETLDTIRLAKQNKYNTIISHRSGDTEDTTIAHLAVGLDLRQIKTGSMARSERLAKYNELIRINEQIDSYPNYAGTYFMKAIPKKC